MTAELSRTPSRNEGRDSDVPREIQLAEERRLSYAEYGPTSGTPVVFFHGTPGSRRLGKLFEAEAQANGVRLLALDRPGYGRSSPRAHRTIDDAARFVTAVLDDASVESARLIAFSGGAPYAFAAARSLPDRIDRLDVVSGATPPTVTDDRPALQRLLGEMATTTPRLLSASFRAQVRLARHRDPSFVIAQYTTGSTAGITDREAEIVREDFLEALSHNRTGVVTELRQAATDWNVDFESIEVGVQLWHGDNDTNVPISAVRRFESELQDGTVRVLEDADHLETLLRSVPEILQRDS